MKKIYQAPTLIKRGSFFQDTAGGGILLRDAWPGHLLLP